jgi:hypothetical protein
MQWSILLFVGCWLGSLLLGILDRSVHKLYEVMRDEYYLVGRRLQNRNNSMVSEYVFMQITTRVD